MPLVKSKIKTLRKILKDLKTVVIAYSGGVDSTFLLKVLSDTLQKKDILAVTAVSETYTKSELLRAKRIAKTLGVRHKEIFTNSLFPLARPFWGRFFCSE